MGPSPFSLTPGDLVLSSRFNTLSIITKTISQQTTHVFLSPALTSVHSRLFHPPASSTQRMADFKFKTSRTQFLANLPTLNLLLPQPSISQRMKVSLLTPIQHEYNQLHIQICLMPVYVLLFLHLPLCLGLLQ